MESIHYKSLIKIARNLMIFSIIGYLSMTIPNFSESALGFALSLGVTTFTVGYAIMIIPHVIANARALYFEVKGK